MHEWQPWHKSHFLKPQARCECYRLSRGHTLDLTQTQEGDFLVEGGLYVRVQRCGSQKWIKIRSSRLRALTAPCGESSQ